MVSAISGSITQRFIAVPFSVLVCVESKDFKAEQKAEAADSTSHPRQPAPIRGEFIAFEEGVVVREPSIAQGITRAKCAGGADAGGTAMWTNWS